MDGRRAVGRSLWVDNQTTRLLLVVVGKVNLRELVALKGAVLEVSLFRVGRRDGGRLLRLCRRHGCKREGL